ncbi:MAG TPA: YgcG family protein [Allosphingosinicella sp.]|nr:YgcG family protein [Allosphingosinicella sp.]
MILVRLLLLLCIFAGAPAHAQQFPKLSGRVVDQADLLSPADEGALTQKLQALEQASSRQLVVATVPDLQGYPIEEYGYRLGRAWGLGQKDANNGVILLVSKDDRKVRVEVGYGLEPIMTDALSSLIIQNQILPRFRENDYPGGINAGADAIIEQLQAPPELAEQRVLQASQQRQQQQARSSQRGGSIFPLLFWGFILFFVVLPMMRGGRRGRRYRRGGRGGVFIWGPGMGGGGGGVGGFGGGGGGGFGGFSGGGGSFGGGGASGGW